MHSVFGMLQRLNRERVPQVIYRIADSGRCLVHTLIARVLAWWWGIEVGPGCRFYGLPLFRRLPGAKIRIGANCQFRSAVWSDFGGISRPCIISSSTSFAELEIGSGCTFHGAVVRGDYALRIGDRVSCGTNATITDNDGHPLGWQARQSTSFGAMAPVIIGDDACIGMNTIVLKGVEIGEGTVVEAGSIVTRSLPAGVIAAGQPAVAIRELTGDEDFASLRVGELGRSQLVG